MEGASQDASLAHRDRMSLVGGEHLDPRAVALRVMLLLFLVVAFGCAVLQMGNFTSAADDPNPPTAARTDLSIIDSGPPVCAAKLQPSTPPTSPSIGLTSTPSSRQRAVSRAWM